MLLLNDLDIDGKVDTEEIIDGEEIKIFRIRVFLRRMLRVSWIDGQSNEID